MELPLLKKLFPSSLCLESPWAKVRTEGYLEKSWWFKELSTCTLHVNWLCSQEGLMTFQACLPFLHSGDGLRGPVRPELGDAQSLMGPASSSHLLEPREAGHTQFPYEILHFIWLDPSFWSWFPCFEDDVVLILNENRRSV